MTAIWRPATAIRVKVIGLAWRKDQLLAADVLTDAGTVKGVRPLGGSIDYGETREQALQREFIEELGTAITIQSAWQTFENIYTHEGALGHEFIFAADVELSDATFYQRDTFTFSEHDGTVCLARWIDLKALKAAGLMLYPGGLAGYLASRSGTRREERD